jgi:hypothetical protein
MSAALARTLALIERHDLDYPTRYRLVLEAVGHAAAAGLDVGMAYDPAVDPAYPIVVYIELPDRRQVSWHMPQHDRSWDGHTTAEKYRRIVAYIRTVAA